MIDPSSKLGLRVLEALVDLVAIFPLGAEHHLEGGLKGGHHEKGQEDHYSGAVESVVDALGALGFGVAKAFSVFWEFKGSGEAAGWAHAFAADAD